MTTTTTCLEDTIVGVCTRVWFHKIMKETALIRGVGLIEFFHKLSVLSRRPMAPAR
jgi:hypothetical protein